MHGNTGQVKTMLISILCLLALIAQVAAMATDPAAGLSTKIEANRLEALNAINKCRRNVNPTATDMVEVKWSTEAAETALNYAKECRVLEHSDPSQRKLPSGYECGENLFFASYPASWTVAIAAFCNESEYFVYGVGAQPEGSVTGHYTQTVWYRSFLAGCDAYYCPDQDVFKFIYVCHHCPPGNIKGSINTPYEAGPTCGKCPNACNEGLCTNPCYYNLEANNCKDYKAWCYDNYIKQNCPGTCGCNNGEIV